MGTEPTQRDIYDRIAAVDNKLTELSATVRAELAHGARKMDDLDAADAALSARITLLEQAKWRATGAAGTVGALAGGAAGSLLSWLLARHP